MSTPIQLEQLIEPRLNIRQDHKYYALRGADDLMYMTRWAPSPNTPFLSFMDTNPTGGLGTIIGRKMYMTWEMHLIFTTAAGKNTNPILQAQTDGLRAFPITSCIETATIKINGVPISVSQLRDNIHARAHYFDNEARSLAISPSASAILDWTQDYRDSYASINNPLGIWTDSGLFAGKTRGVISNLKINQNTPTIADIQFEITEPIFIHPLQFGTNENETGMCGIQTMTFEFITSRRERMWSHDFVNGSAIDNLSVETLKAALHINYINPPSDFVFPPVCVLPYTQFLPFSQQNLGGPLNPGESREVQSGVIKLISSPQYILLFAKMKNNVRDSTLENMIGCTDTFAAIDRITLQYGPRTDLLGSVLPIQLYEICVANGLKLDWQSFRGNINKAFDTDPVSGQGINIGLTGSIVKLMISKDIVAGPSFIPGMGTNSDLQIRCTIRNVNPYMAIDYDLWVFSVYEGIITFNGTTALPSVSVIPNVEMARSAPVSAADFTSNERAFGNALAEGGSFLSALGAIPLIGNVISGISGAVKGLLGGPQPQPQVIMPQLQALPASPGPHALMPRRNSLRRQRLGRSVMGLGLEGGEIASPNQLNAVARKF